MRRLRKRKRTSLSISALCGADWSQAMQEATGIHPATSPPLTGQTDDLFKFLSKASKSDVFAVNLHGYYGQCNLYGQKDGQPGPMALTPRDVIMHDWSNVVVFMEVCYSASAASGNRILVNAFLDSGALAVIGSKTEAYGRIKPTLPIPGSDGEADRLLQFFIHWTKRGSKPGKALQKAKRSLKVWSFPLDKEDRATLRSFVALSKR